MRANDSAASTKKVGMKATLKPWFHTEIISAIQKKTNYI